MTVTSLKSMGGPQIGQDNYVVGASICPNFLCVEVFVKELAANGKYSTHIGCDTGI